MFQVLVIKKEWQTRSLIPTNDTYQGAVRIKEKTPAQVQAQRNERKITV